ncbi:chaperonin-like RbcX protein 2, chloroplastic [Capsicum annuum]|uniref:chaperonin-like RbcX protein 2, chloroplastic n=1 Tax=Capsicum annuum TaxID=4072 RepID=UPI001FB190BC|nr:chaperonin-like RbcX protein 2, chloroplastic [Capsicum annuum]
MDTFLKCNHHGKEINEQLKSSKKERRKLAERVMITRLSLYNTRMQKCDHTKLYNKISDKNVKLVRERLTQTIIWPFEDDEIVESLD